MESTAGLDKDVFDSYIKAGRIAAESLQYGRSLMKVGVKVVDVCDAVEEFVHKQGGGLAFPVQISLNHVAAHNCPAFDDTTVFKTGDIAKIDVGVHVNGYIGDNALSVDFGGWESLVKASRDAVEEVADMAKAGVSLSEVGAKIQNVISGYGFQPIKNLSGHGLAKFVIHDEPTVPNYDNHSKIVLKKGMVVACEPFATNGRGSIVEGGNPEVYMLVQLKPVRSPFAREVLETIKSYQGLPFAKRWLVRKHGVGKTSFALKELVHSGIVHEFGQLPEASKGMVSQAEHTLIIDDDRAIVTTRLS